MKHLVLLCALIASVFTCGAQTEIDKFNVGPYEVYYSGPGDYRFRLSDNIDLYEYYELRKDTTIISVLTETPVKNAIMVSGKVGATGNVAKELGVEGVWKQNIGKNLYFNGGLSITLGLTHLGGRTTLRNMFEVGIPLQVELGKLNHQRGTLYGHVGLMPTVYTTLYATKWENGQRVNDIKKTGFLIMPSVEIGGNIPVGKVIARLGFYGSYKINCTPSDLDVYKYYAGRMFIGARIGIIL